MRPKPLILRGTEHPGRRRAIRRIVTRHNGTAASVRREHNNDTGVSRTDNG